MDRVGIQGAAQGFADQGNVVRRILAQVRFDLIADLVAQVDEVAIEILATLQLEAAQRHIHQHLFQADRVGDRHQYDFAAQQALGFELAQALLEVPGDQHAGQFVGVQ
ncbi:hypothetical protein D3C72_1594700 [compost metagenome]